MSKRGARSSIPIDCHGKAAQDQRRRPGDAVRKTKPRTQRPINQSYPLEHVPEKWVHFSDKDMLQLFELARILDRSGDSTRSEYALRFGFVQSARLGSVIGWIGEGMIEPA
jgi:hypothetical protein